MAHVITERFHLSDISDPRFRSLIEVWYRQRSGDLLIPHWRDIDPFAVPSLAGAVILFDVADDLDLAYRIVGEDVAAALGGNPKGKHPFDIVGDGAYGRFIVSQLHDCVLDRLPVFSQHDFRFENDNLARQATRIALPYGETDRVSRLLCYQIFSREIEIRGRRQNADMDFHVRQLGFVLPDP